MFRRPVICDDKSTNGASWRWRRLRCMSVGDLTDLVTSTFNHWIDDKAPRLGASLAFYTLLSIAPMIIVVLAIAGLAFGEEAAEGRLMWEIRSLVGPQGAAAVQAIVKSARAPGSGTLATILGLATLLFSATAAVAELRDALNTIWHVAPSQSSAGWGRSLIDMAKDRVFSFAMIVGVGFLLLVSLVVNAWLAAAGTFFSSLLPTPEWVLQTLYTIFSFVVITALFALLFKVLPSLTLEWGDVIVGAAVTSVLFSVGKLLIGLYLGKTSFANTYGAAGSLVIVLVWVYYSAQIFFLGAEFTRAYTYKHGSLFRRQLELIPSRPEVQVVAPAAPAPEPVLVIDGQMRKV